MVYVDDVIVFSRSHAEHLRDLREVFQLVRAAGLKLRLEKAQIGKREVEYLGHSVSARGTRPSKKNTEKIRKWPTPTDHPSLRTFVYLCNYYRGFVQKFAQIAYPLTELLKTHDKDKKPIPFQWTTAADEAFQDLRRRLTEPPIMTFPDMRSPFIVKPDASQVSIGGVLVQVRDGKERVVAYASRALIGAEPKYGAHEREALATVYCCQQWRHYLLGSVVFVQTDHKPNLAMEKNKLANERVGKWARALQEYAPKFFHKDGKAHADADSFSRMPLPAEHSVDTGAPFCRHCNLPVDGSIPICSGLEASIAGVEVGGVSPLAAAVPFLDKVKAALPSDPFVSDLFRYLQEGTLPVETSRRKNVMA
uniref:Reverse transcriptase domain-containing protein n=1 Tax=Chromera velia CCMP2878 TaxID=1169474 RepID=A0A0G4GXP6_9ALVE|eukprot:Cvel_23816.t1-p1 / transcript=Cvel_23816.t1 / gene=Cvel_23816 / organism=Chromera_velia_CCMP2878 / gene_product=Retrovirus-related Pol polyprotein from transposon, putative / transcript_product=Retrovirus-related Pol polyprotein from transposon, putative / location=Cvel_scaffold2502:9-1097(+) / protein_length=363 / sequence_SO=supercontig / SO=protein_coding / is_pseudo=false